MVPLAQSGRSFGHRVSSCPRNRQASEVPRTRQLALGRIFQGRTTTVVRVEEAETEWTGDSRSGPRLELSRRAPCRHRSARHRFQRPRRGRSTELGQSGARHERSGDHRLPQRRQLCLLRDPRRLQLRHRRAGRKPSGAGFWGRGARVQMETPVEPIPGASQQISLHNTMPPPICGRAGSRSRCLERPRTGASG